MKYFLFRILLFIVMGIGIFFSPWIFLVLGSIMLGIFFRFPVEILFWGASFELSTGITPGIFIIPIACAITAQKILASRFDMQSVFTKPFLLLAGTVFFIGFRALFAFAVFHYPQSLSLSSLFTL